MVKYSRLHPPAVSFKKHFIVERGARCWAREVDVPAAVGVFVELAGGDSGSVDFVLATLK